MDDEKQILLALAAKAGEILMSKSFDIPFIAKNKPAKDINKIIHSYIKKRMTKLLVVNTIVLGNRRVLLDDIYVPLTIVSEKEEYYIDRYPEVLYNLHSTVLIKDTSGMGKSTILRKLFFSTIYQDLGIPFLIELRRLKDQESLLMYVLKELKIKEDSPESIAINYLFERGGFVFFFDGYDEVTDSDKAHVSDCIHKFIEDYHNCNRFFITSRAEPGLLEFGNFAEFSIKGLEEEESFDLIRKYDRSKEVSELLIQKLKEPQLQGLKDFLKNPLLTSLLYRAFEYKNKIPIRKNQFYRQVYDANFEAHDLTKGGAYFRPKKSNLDTEDFHRILRFIGFQCFQRQKVEFDSKDNILSVITEAKNYYNLQNMKSSDFLEDLLKSVPLFSRDGNYYKWTHRSLQEYFASQFIFMDSKSEQNDILKKIYSHKSLKYYFHTLELYADTDPISFRNVIELQFLTDYIAHYEKSIAEFGKSTNEIQRRIDHLFFRKLQIAQDSNPEFLKVPVKFEIDHVHTEEEEIDISEDLLMELHGFKIDDVSDYDFYSNWLLGGIITWPRYGINTFVSINSNIKAEISDILYNMDRKYIIKPQFATRRTISIILSSNKQDKVFQLDFNNKMWYNRPRMISKINDLLDMQNYIYRFNIDLVKSEVKKIREGNVKNDDFIKF